MFYLVLMYPSDVKQTFFYKEATRKKCTTKLSSLSLTCKLKLTIVEGPCLWLSSLTSSTTGTLMSSVLRGIFVMPFFFHPHWFFIKVVHISKCTARGDQPPSCFHYLSFSAPLPRPYFCFLKKKIKGSAALRQLGV